MSICNHGMELLIHATAEIRVLISNYDILVLISPMHSNKPNITGQPSVTEFQYFVTKIKLLLLKFSLNFGQNAEFFV